MHLIDYLARFNRKERFFLVGMALDNRSFQLGAEFRKCIKSHLGLDVPADAFAAMDYHLDWIYAGLKLASNAGNSGPYSNVTKVIRAHQEDIDFIFAYQRAGICHVVLLEAKGVTGWSTARLRSKAERLGEIFGQDGYAFDGVKPYFALISPHRPHKLVTERWPNWMKPGDAVPWMELPVASERLKVTRCTPAGVPSKDGDYWRVTPA